MAHVNFSQYLVALIICVCMVSCINNSYLPRKTKDGQVVKVPLRIPKGFKEIKQKGKAEIYYNGKIYISPDIDGHGSNGRGSWKAASSIENLKTREKRYGTYDENGRWFRK